ncbi:MAG: hypothetical protein J07HR59_00858 [Halorubrum sp. J07HR59]|nr:MAG: hypothetical protein J07HR59_00858 [Halorubrum sp. J07HR59]
MDEKTEDLRDIFIDTTGAEEVTASQEETPGNLLGGDEDADAGERVAALVALVDDRYGLDAPLSPEEYERVVYGVFDGESDAEIAESLGVEESAVFGARMDLHLVRDDDREAPFSLDRLRELMSRDWGCQSASTHSIQTSPRFVTTRGSWQRIWSLRAPTTDSVTSFATC